MPALRQSLAVNDSRLDAALITRRVVTMRGETNFCCVRGDLSGQNIGGSIRVTRAGPTTTEPVARFPMRNGCGGAGQVAASRNIFKKLSKFRHNAPA
jgi:hypothetical protein